MNSIVDFKPIEAGETSRNKIIAGVRKSIMSNQNNDFNLESEGCALYITNKEKHERIEMKVQMIGRDPQ